MLLAVLEKGGGLGRLFYAQCIEFAIFPTRGGGALEPVLAARAVPAPR